ncbi:hypothetical protein OEZ86_003133 [Tetradesmus obliquus]|nr:hypothetical protein OEZ86_003133 [Tetradesmus obliquus]
MVPGKRVKSFNTANNHKLALSNVVLEGMSMEEGLSGAAAVDTNPQPAESVLAVCSDQNLLKDIFHRLDIRDLCSASCVCSLWNQVGSSEDFWKEVSFKDKLVYPHQVSALLWRHRCVQLLDLSGLTCGLSDPNLLARIAPCLQQLTELRFCSKHSVTDQHTMERVLGVLSSKLPALRVLSLHGMLVSGLPTASCAISHPGLTSLLLTGSDALVGSLRCSSLQRLSLASSNIQRLPGLAACPALVSLDVRGCKKLQDSSIRAALPGLTGLQELTMGQGVPVTDDTVREMASSLTVLTKLVLSDTPGLSLSNVRDFPSLRLLDLSRCESLTPAALQPAAESCEQLEELLLDGCHMLTTLKLTMPHLKEISLRGCVALSDLDLNCWRLATLRLGPIQSGSPGNSTLQRLALNSGALRRMEWVQCRKLSHLELNCPYLTELTIRECDNITPAALEALGDKGAPPAAAPGLLAGTSGAAADAAAVSGLGAAGAPGVWGGSLHQQQHRLQQQQAGLWRALQDEADADVALFAGALEMDEDDEAGMPHRYGDGLLPGFGLGLGLAGNDSDDDDDMGGAAAAVAPAAAAFLVGGFGPGGLGGGGGRGGGGGGGGGGPPMPIQPPRPPAAAGGGGGGVPALRVLRVEGCDGLRRLSLKHSRLQTLCVSGCRSLGQLVVSAPSLAALELDEVADLAAVSLQQVGLPSLSLGGCSGLTGLELSSSSLHKLDLRGCGQLTQLLLDCPGLHSMDATFCSELGDAGVASAVANAPPLTQLVLSVCCQVGSSGLQALSALSTLQELDLSYTEVSDLRPVFASCPQLRTLSLSSCGSLAADALAPLLAAGSPALPQLASLDVEVLQPKHYLLSGDRASLHARQASYDWVEVPSAVSGLTSLRAGLSGAAEMWQPCCRAGSRAAVYFA